MTTSKDYERQRQAEHDEAVGAGKDPEDFKRNKKGEIFCKVTCDGCWLLSEKLLVIASANDCERVEVKDFGISFDVPESNVGSLMAALRKLGYSNTNNHGRINTSGIPEDLD
jgi:hypothetical protein